MQNGAVEKDFIDRMLENPIKDLRRAIKDSLKQCYLQELDKGKVSLILKFEMKDREVKDPSSANMNATMEVTDIETDYTVKHQVTIDETSKGTFYDPSYSVDFDTAGNVSFNKIKSAQTTIFDEDSASNYGRQVDSTGKVLDFTEPENEDEREEFAASADFEL